MIERVAASRLLSSASPGGCAPGAIPADLCFTGPADAHGPGPTFRFGTGPHRSAGGATPASRPRDMEPN